MSSEQKTKAEPQASRRRLDQLVRPLEVGEVIEAGDMFMDDGGTLVKMDMLGRMYGVRFIGHAIVVGGSWFRAMTNPAVEGRTAKG